MSYFEAGLNQSTSDIDHDDTDSSRLYNAPSLDAYLQPEIDLPASQAPSLNENELSEEKLRDLYDDEEIERFLHLFSAYVTEVQAPETPNDTQTSFHEEDDVASYHTRASEDSAGWVPPSTSQEHLPAASRSGSTQYDSISKEIAYRYIVPNLPHSRPTPPFTFSRLRLATERSYLAIIPVYGPFLKQLYDLARWEDPTTSSIYCFGFWILWWYNLIAPTLLFRIFFSLLKRRILPYPSLEDLRRRREEVLRADEFGEQVSARLSSKASNIMEIWRLFKIYNHANKSHLNLSANKSPKDKERQERSSTDELNDDSSEQTILETGNETQEVQDLKRIGLQLLEELADLHERIHNIFNWRRPSSSRLYGMILAAMLVMSFLPSKFIIKGIVFAIGFSFWHLIPIFLALPSPMRKRVPPPFWDVPTDAEYAMELISQRVAAGLDLTPSRKRKKSDVTESADVASGHKKSSSSQGNSSSSVDWKKWGDRVGMGKSAISNIKRLRPGSPLMVHEVWPPRHPLLAGVIGIAQPQATPELHTYPGQHGSTPGLLTLTHNALLFTPLISRTPKVVIPLTAVKGVKKAGLLKGLNIRWNDSIDGLKEQKEDKFSWIGDRDELFARLVGSDSKRWMKV